MSITEAPVTTDERQVSDLIDELLEQFPPTTSSTVDFLGAQFDKGLAWVHFPEGFGGLGISPKLQKTINERIAAGRGPQPLLPQPDRLRHVRADGGRVGERGPEARYLRPLFTGEEIWCQLFSEPGAGSDVAGLSTRGVRDGDEWVVNGQKVWTTLAHVSRWGLLVARTDPERRKHAGLTVLRRRHARARRRGAPAAPDDRRGRVQRGVLHRRPHPRRRAARRRRRRLARLADHAHERAGVDRRRRRPAGLRPHRRGRQDLEAASPPSARTGDAATG